MLLNKKVRLKEADTHRYEPMIKPARRQVLKTSQGEYNIGFVNLRIMLADSARILITV